MSTANILPIVQEAAEIVGGYAALAGALGIARQNFYQWRRRVPAERVLAIEAATGGRVSRHRLRPDLYGPAPAGAGSGAQSPALGVPGDAAPSPAAPEIRKAASESDRGATRDAADAAEGGSSSCAEDAPAGGPIPWA